MRRALTTVVCVLLAVLVFVGFSTMPAAEAALRGSAKSYRVAKSHGKVVRWNPCATVEYKVNTTYAGKGALTDTKKAMTVIAKETGIRFVYAGRTKTIPTTRTSQPSGQLTIAWAKPGKGKGRSDLLPGGSVLGVGGYLYAYRTDRAGKVSRLQITQGYVVLDARHKLPGGFSSPGADRGALLLHELGHAVGLDHVNDRKQLMYPEMTGHSSVGAGDHAGFRKVGRSAGCIAPLD